MRSRTFTYFSLVILGAVLIHVSAMIGYNTSDLLDPAILRPFMFTEEIFGNLTVFEPKGQQTQRDGTIVQMEYEITAMKTQIQILPKTLFNKTTMYLYAGYTKKGEVASYPGGAILARKNVKTKIKWRINITGPHILAMDYTAPFPNTYQFRRQVPFVPHIHGVATNMSSDGMPQGYWTINGFYGKHYSTQQPSRLNEAIYYYMNEQQAGNYWYHDHVMGFTRGNVYAGLAGLYKIENPNCPMQKYLTANYGADIDQKNTKYLVITDKSFTKKGELFYPRNTTNPNFKNWVPQFFGNTMMVNGVLWPKMKLAKKLHRFVLLNACNSRYLNIWFENNGNKIPMKMLRVDGDFYNKTTLYVTQLFATISTRFEFILDLTGINGEIILKNNAPSPYPMGDPDNFNPQFTGQIMKIIMNNTTQSINNSWNNYYYQNLTQLFNQIPWKQSYPLFEPGTNYFMTILEVINPVTGMLDAGLLDGETMELSQKCERNQFQIGKTYDFHIINLTPDTHPIHIHLTNMQLVKRYKMHTTLYQSDYYKQNGGAPTKFGFPNCSKPLDPGPYRADQDQLPLQHQKVFRDTIDAQPDYVTVVRIRFSQNNGQDWIKFYVGGQCFPIHCHILEHEDLNMMKHFCLKHLPPVVVKFGNRYQSILLGFVLIILLTIMQ